MEVPDALKSVLLTIAPLYQCVPKPVWRRIKRGLGYATEPGTGSDWLSRREMNYYHEVVRLAREYARAAGCVLDVGSNETELVTALTWIPEKAMLDVAPMPSIEGVTAIQCDFLEFEPEKIDALKPDELKQVEVTITPADEALVGDYYVTINVDGEKDQKTMEMRVTVKASTAWGWIGIGIIVGVIAGLGGLFTWLGRR